MRADDVADLSREQWEHLIEQYIFNEQHRRWDTCRGSLAKVRVA